MYTNENMTIVCIYGFAGAFVESSHLPNPPTTLDKINNMSLIHIYVGMYA